MSDLADKIDDLPKCTIEELEKKHELELIAYRNESKELFKAIKKSEKAIFEAKRLQGEYNLRSQQNEKLGLLEAQIGVD